MAVTIYDIAKVVKTSHATVSRALNNYPQVNKKTREHIQNVAKSLGYRPNFAATALKMGKTNKLALLLPDLIDPFFAEFLRDAEHNCLLRDYKTVVIQSLLGATYEKSLEELLKGLCDGVIVFTSSFKKLESVAEQFRVRGMPFIAIGIRTEKGEAKVDTIEENVGRGIEMAVDHLVRLGHKEIVFFDNTPCLSEADSNRLEGLKRAFGKHGLKLQKENIFYFGAYDNRGGITGSEHVVELRESGAAMNQTNDGFYGIKKLMDGYPETTAIIGTSDLLMLGVYRGLLEMGLRVPDDISLVGTDDCWLSRSLPVSLTSIDMKTQQLASTAVKWFFDRIEGGDWNQPRRIVIDSGLVIRESTGKAKKH